ncbi:isochorismatase family protein [Myxococcota bacterium]|nr:isochorismatase family protein [Myxococcota bacterium]
MTDLTLRTDDTLLLVVDVQEKLAPAMHESLRPRLFANLERLGKAAALLGLPVILTEQYPKGLGPTIDRVKADFEGHPVFEKLVFDAAKDDGIAKAIATLGRKKIVVAGMETHVCVYQTVRTLAATHTVHVLSDAVASRAVENYETGLRLARAAGGIVTSTEVVLFDLLGQAGTDAFRAISRLVR